MTQLALWGSAVSRGDSASTTDATGASGRRTTPRTAVVCAGCGKTITRPKRGQRFCSGTCRYAAWDLKHPRKGSPKAEAARRRDAALARVEENSGEWMELAGKALEVLCAFEHGWEAPWEAFKADLLAGGLRKPHHPNVWGALVRKALKAGWLTRVGYCAASSPESHGTEMRIYRVRGD